MAVLSGEAFSDNAKRAEFQAREPFHVVDIHGLRPPRSVMRRAGSS